MSSRIYWGEVGHWRRSPEHTLSYPIFTFGIDLSQPCREYRVPLLFNRNCPAVLSIYDRDYLGFGIAPLATKVCEALNLTGEAIKNLRTTLITMPRYLGYVFNPVSFFINQSYDGAVHSVVIEVHNTFGESHLYPLEKVSCSDGSTFRFDKSFFVSPFFDVSGMYELHITACTEQKLDIRVELMHEGVCQFSARLSGVGKPITLAGVLSTLARYPFTSVMTMPRIHREALKLYSKKASIFEKPVPKCPFTFHSKQGPIHKTRLGLLKRLKNRNNSSVLDSVSK